MSVPSPFLINSFSSVLLIGRSGLEGPPDKAMLLWLSACICDWLAGYLSIFLGLVVGFRPRFHSGHLASFEVPCLKRQTI